MKSSPVSILYNLVCLCQKWVVKSTSSNPEKPDSWEGIRDFSIPVKCPNPDLNLFLSNRSTVLNGKEDCLYLSVHIPKNANSLPVMVYIHGGAFITGSGIVHEPHELLNEDIVLVVMNYRLGILGFLSTEDDVMPGNLGLKDQNMALRWTKDNIPFFGGDTSRITIFGESAGSASVHYQILSPYSKGLFHRAILQSGTALCPWTHSLNQRNIAFQVGASLGCFSPSTIGKEQSEILLKCLQEIDVRNLAVKFNKFMLWSFFPTNFGPYVDHDFVPDEPEVLLREGRYNKVDSMIGVAKDEGAFISYAIVTENEQAGNLASNPEYYAPISIGMNYEGSSQEITKKVYEYYTNGIYDISKGDLEKFTQMYGDRHFAVCSDIVALQHSSHNKVFFYQFDFKGPRTFAQLFDTKIGEHWISHAEELFILFPFNTVFGYNHTRQSDEEKVRDIMTKTWTNFATIGNPTPDNSLGFKWEETDQNILNYLSIKVVPEMKQDTRKKIREFWKSLPTAQNKMLYGKDFGSSCRTEL